MNRRECCVEDSLGLKGAFKHWSDDGQLIDVELPFVA